MKPQLPIIAPKWRERSRMAGNPPGGDGGTFLAKLCRTETLAARRDSLANGGRSAASVSSSPELPPTAAQLV